MYKHPEGCDSTGTPVQPRVPLNAQLRFNIPNGESSSHCSGCQKRPTRRPNHHVNHLLIQKRKNLNNGLNITVAKNTARFSSLTFLRYGVGDVGMRKEGLFKSWSICNKKHLLAAHTFDVGNAFLFCFFQERSE